MAVTSATSGYSMDAISNSYIEPVKEEDPLGRQAFLTMLVAQLQHQDPLNPMEGTDFTTQLAQFSSLEQQFEMNDSLESIAAAMTTREDENLLDYIGKDIVGEAKNITVEDGVASMGYYNIEENAEVAVSIYDSIGRHVRTIYQGQQASGSYEFLWDGVDSSMNYALDGNYTFEVTAVNEYGGSVKTQTTVNGKVTGLTYEDGRPYLVVDGKLVDPSGVLTVNLAEENEPEATETEPTQADEQ